ncbi:MAG: ABC transporter substrate-binding protein [Acidimicrobiales bacterium]
MRRNDTKHRRAFMSSLIVGVLSIGMVVSTAGVASAASSGGSSSNPIVLGGIYTNTPIPFGADALAMSKAVFADVNAHGGIRGQQIRYMFGDDGGSNATAAADARQFVGAGAVAMVGDASFSTCGQNSGYYLQQNIVDIVAVGVDPLCYASPNIASVEPSPYLQLTASLYFAAKYLHVKRQCLFQPLTPGAGTAISNAIKAYEKAAHQTLTIKDTSLSTSGTVDFTPLLLRAKLAGCQSFFYGGATDTIAHTLLQTAKTQGLSKLNMLLISISYTKQLAQTSESLGVPAYVTASLYPFTQVGKQNAGFRALAQKYHVNQTEFSLDAYVAANWVVSVLKSIKGPITRAKVTAAFKKGAAYKTPLSTAPLVFGPAKTHNALVRPTIVQLTKNGWKLRLLGMKVPGVTS